VGWWGRRREELCEQLLEGAGFGVEEGTGLRVTYLVSNAGRETNIPRRSGLGTVCCVWWCVCVGKGGLP
jgi:hypothetical protein